MQTWHRASGGRVESDAVFQTRTTWLAVARRAEQTIFGVDAMVHGGPRLVVKLAVFVEFAYEEAPPGELSRVSGNRADVQPRLQVQSNQLSPHVHTGRNDPREVDVDAGLGRLARHGWLCVDPRLLSHFHLDIVFLKERLEL